MINGLGVLGWGVGGIEAEAVMLGHSISMLLPQVVGYKLYGELNQYVTSTDLVLTITKVSRLFLTLINVKKKLSRLLIILESTPTGCSWKIC